MQDALKLTLLAIILSVVLLIFIFFFAEVLSRVSRSRKYKESIKWLAVEYAKNMIPRGINSTLAILKYSILLVFLFLLPLNSYASKEFYTIQTGSFIIPEYAQQQFDSLTLKLDDTELNNLRIEKINKYYSVRLGKFENKSAAKKFLHVVTPQFPGAIILKVYIKDERIVRLYRGRPSLTENNRLEETPISTAKPDKVKSTQLSRKTTPANELEALIRTRGLVKEGNYKEALSLLSPFTSEPMKYPTAVSDYLVILVWDGRLDDAISMYENLPASFPIRDYLLRNMAKAYYDKKEFLKAVSLYQASLEQTPLDEEAQKGIVFSLIQTGDFDRASDYLKKFLTKAPDSLSLAVAKAYLLSWQGRYMEALKVYHMLTEREDVDKEHVYQSRDDLIASLPVEKRQAMVADLHNAVQGGDETARMDYILVLVLNKDYKTAIRAFETANMDIDQYPDYLLCWIAWAYFKTGNTEKAKLYYQRVLATRQNYVRANIGLAYCLAEEGQGDRAINILDKLLLTEPRNPEIRFARAYVYEKSKRFWLAIQEYDHILKISRRNLVARRLRLQALSDLGVSSHALEEANKDFPHDLKLLDSIKGDTVVDRIRWKEYGEAISMLLPQLEDSENLRARYDYIITLVENNDMEEAVEAYKSLIKVGISPPLWILEEVAEAYLYLKQPYNALKLYDEALKTRPDSFNGRMGRFYVLQEIRDWERAKKVLDNLDRETPEVLREGKKIRPNWPKIEITLARGWLLVYEDRLREAEEYFWNLHERAPANTGFRTGLAHVYLWRGWPRKAMRKFQIIESLDPKDVKTQVGKISALNALAFKEQARKEAGDLRVLHPKNKHVQELVRQLEVEEMRELVTDFVITWDEDGVEERRSEITLSQPISFYTRLYGFLLWQKTLENDQKSYFRRTGLGINHIFSSSWSLRQQFSVNYDDADDFGVFTQINFNPDDYWGLNLSYDSFTTDVPMRTRVFDIEANKLNLGITHRESDWRSYHLSLSHSRFSDDNDRNEGLLGYEQGLWVKNNWKMRLFIDLYMSNNSRDDAPYFNPDNDWSLSATHLTEHTLWRIYKKAFVHRLFLTLGTYKQSGFSNETIGSIQYEHDYDFSDTQALLWGVNLARQAFDGEAVNGYSFYLTYRGMF